MRSTTPVLAHAEVVPALGILFVLLAACALVARGVRRRPAARAVPRLLLFGAGAASIVVALSPTVEHVAHERLAWHMTQHLLLTVVAPPLFVLARAGRLAVAGAPAATRNALAPVHRAVSRLRRRRRGEMTIAAAMAAVAVTIAWHVPPAYDAAVQHGLLHGIEHVTFFATALAFWSFVLDARTPVPAALAGLLLFVTSSGALASVLTFAPAALYSTYAPRSDALSDQQLAGLLMWIPGGVPPLLAASFVTVRALAPTPPGRRGATRLQAGRAHP